MKVCYVATDVRLPSFLGSATHVYEVAKNLAEFGVDVHVVCRKEKGQPSNDKLGPFYVHRIPRVVKAVESLKTSPQIERKHSRVIVDKLYPLYLNSIHLSFSIVYVLHVIRKYGIDLVLERGSSRGAGVFAGALTGRPSILEINDPIYNKRSLSMAGRVITTNESFIPRSTPKSKLRIVSWGANTDLFNPSVSGHEIRRKYMLLGKKIIVYVGSFKKWHGLEDLIQASRKIVQRNPKVCFLIIGGDVNLIHFRRIVEIVKELGMDKNFFFSGPVKYEDVPKYINAGDIAVAPYNPTGRPSEFVRKYGFYGSPLKIFEYMACGKPIVTSNVGKIATIIRDKENGLLFSPGNLQELSNALLKLLDNESLAKRFGEAARKDVVDKYSWKSHARLLLEVFHEVL